ncbi:MAG: phosphatidylserine/phosphatidylglycerophosphate/cardiolipin synthase family protein [Elusimicrobia bacterium]|nr:phosphatidylserine/phosphatidylglycerophosphate/cardiolipin synthase family protein [Elusimicrobiota bacterium]
MASALWLFLWLCAAGWAGSYPGIPTPRHLDWDEQEADQFYRERWNGAAADPASVRYPSLELFFRAARFGYLGPVRAMPSDGARLLWSQDQSLSRRFEDLGYSPDSGLIDRFCVFEEIDATYMEWHTGYVQEQLSAALMLHALAGVKVRMILPDNLFIKGEDRRRLKDLERAGVNIAWFKAHGAGNLRDQLNKNVHAKMLRVKKTCGGRTMETMIVGGSNIKDSFFRDTSETILGEKRNVNRGLDSGLSYRDLDVWVEHPGLVQDGKRIFESLFRYATQGSHAEDHAEEASEAEPEQPRAVAVGEAQVCRARIFLSAPFEGDRTWEDLFVGLLDHSREQVVCIAPYYSPSARVWEAVRRAMSRGVKFTLFTNSRFRRDNVPKFLQSPVRHRLNLALDAGVDVREWEDPTVLHAKSCLFDDQVLYVGGANLNMRSFKHDAENGLVFHCGPLAEDWKQAVLADMQARSRPYKRRKAGVFAEFLSNLIEYYY